MIRYFILFLLSVTLLVTSTKVTIYTDDDYRPYSYVDNNRAQGIQIEILKQLFAKMENYTLELKPINWKEGLKKMKKEEILIINNTFYRPKERPYITDYSIAYMFDTPSLYCNREIEFQDPEHIDWAKELKGLVIAKQNGYSLSTSEGFDKAVKKGAIKIIESDNESNIKKLINKKVDCYISENLVVQGLLLQQQREYEEQNKTTEAIDDIQKVATISQEGIHLAFSKKYFAKRKDLIKNINLAIKVMQNSGEIEKIREKFLVKYLTTDIHSKTIDASIYPLGSFVSSKMQGYGLLADIVNAAFANRNISVNYHFHKRNEAYLYNKWGKTCMSFPWTKKADTWQYSFLSVPIMTSDINFFYEENNLPEGIEYRDLYDLKNYRIGGIKGSFYEKFFGGMSFDYSSYDNVKELLTALTLKKIDILPMDRYIFLDYVKEYMPYKLDEFVHDEKPMTQKVNYILFSKNCRDAGYFRDEFNEGFKTIQNDGTFDKILAKYTTTDQEKEEFEKIFRNVKKVAKAEEESVFDANATEDSNISDINLSLSRPIPN